MISRDRLGLTSAILASLASLLLLTWLLLSIISFKTAEKDLLSQKIAHASTLLTMLLATIPDDFAASREPGAQLQRAIDAIAADRDFAGLLIISTDGRVAFARGDSLSDPRLAATMQGGGEVSAISDSGQLLLTYAPVGNPSSPLGAARLSLSLGDLQARLVRSRTLFLGYFILDFVLLLFLGGYMLRRIVVAPLERLLAATERIIAGDYGHPVAIRGRGEIAGLARSFNAMQSTLRVRQEEVEKYVRSLEEANLALQEARQEAIRSEKMASIGLLAAGMAHEIGTPLAAIIGYNGVLVDELAADPEKSDYLRRIAREAERIDRLVRELLDYARPGKGEAETIHLQEFIDDLLAMLGGQGVLKRLTVTNDLAQDLPPLYLDRHKLMQVLVNLIINARDAMPQGGELNLTATTEPGWVVLCVTDSGAGMAPEVMEKVFEPFFTTKEPGKGTGLGLAISARLVDSFGGSIGVESEPGKGTRFTVRLPVKGSEK